MTAHVVHNSGNNEWYTPSLFVEAARRTMGSIDLDPASTSQANEVIGASLFYTKETNGLEQDWRDNVFLNPPYAQPLIQLFIEKLYRERDHLGQAILLVNNATETKWFQRAISSATAVCFPAKRIRFWGPKGEKGQPLQGQTFIYYASALDNRRAFNREFKTFGKVLIGLTEL